MPYARTNGAEIYFERHGDDGEHRLEGDERRAGKGPVDGAHHAVQPEVLQGVADEAAEGLAEDLAVAPEHPGDRDGPHRDEAHHHHVEDALGPHHAAVEEGETGGHEEHEGGAHQDPCGVAGVDLVHAGSVRSDSFTTRLLVLPPCQQLGRAG